MANYGVYLNGSHDNDQADWSTNIDDALAIGYSAAERGDDVEIMKFDENDECDWDWPIVFDEEGRPWSEDRRALEEMGVIM